MSDQLLAEIRDLLVEGNAMTRKSMERADEIMAMSKGSAARVKTLSTIFKVFMVLAAIVILVQLFR
ncbi:MAG: hypothetical protein WCO25_05095 [Candidatus Uhrbacteria bacterium]